MSAWYLHSLAPGQTHLGDYSPATNRVRTICGIEFIPLTIGLGNRIALNPVRTDLPHLSPQGALSVTPAASRPTFGSSSQASRPAPARSAMRPFVLTQCEHGYLSEKPPVPKNSASPSPAMAVITATVVIGSLPLMWVSHLNVGNPYAGSGPYIGPHAFTT